MPSPTKWVCLPVVFLVAFWTRLPAMGQGQGSPVDSPSMVPAQSASRDPDAVQSPAQSAPKNGGDSLTLNWNDVEQSIWANAKTYVDLPVPDLVGAVPELKALAPETSQEGLASLLGHIGQSCVDLFRHTPNLASHEVQITQQRGVNRISQGAFAPELTHSERQEFGYLLLFRATQDVTGVAGISHGQAWASDRKCELASGPDDRGLRIGVAAPFARKPTGIAIPLPGARGYGWS